MLDDLTAKLIRLEESLFQASTRSSIQALDKLIADDFTEINAAGKQFGKSEVLTRLPTEAAPEITGEDYELRMLTDEYAQLLYRAKVKRLAHSEASFSKRCSIWRNNKGEWQMTYHQGTPCE